MGRVLVPIAVLEAESVPLGLMDLLGTMDVTVLGYHVLPEQTPPEQAQLQYEERATDALEDVAEEFRRAGGDADFRLVFTHDRERTIARVAEDVGAGAYARLGATGAVERLLVPLPGEGAPGRLLDFVAELIGDRGIAVTLFVPASEDPAVAEERLAEAVRDLEGRGLDVGGLAGTEPGAFGGLIEAVADHDAIVMGEPSPTLRSMLLGEETGRIATESVGPVIVVRREPPGGEP